LRPWKVRPSRDGLAVLGSRQVNYTSSIDPKFAALIEDLAPKCAALLATKLVRRGEFPAVMPQAGLYLFSTPIENLYVGRANECTNQQRTDCRSVR
jgi:hypothetical protein